MNLKQLGTIARATTSGRMVTAMLMANEWLGRDHPLYPAATAEARRSLALHRSPSELIAHLLSGKRMAELSEALRIEARGFREGIVAPCLKTITLPRRQSISHDNRRRIPGRRRVTTTKFSAFRWQQKTGSRGS